MVNPTERRSAHPSNRAAAGTEEIAALGIPTTQKPKLLEQVRHAIRIRHLSPQTEQAYISRGVRPDKKAPLFEEEK